MVRWIDALAKTRRNVQSKLRNFIERKAGGKAESFETLEEALIAADVAPRLAAEWVSDIERGYTGLNVDRRALLKKLLLDKLGDERPFSWPSSPRPYTILVVGVNGAGKTTTCAKLAHNAKEQGLKPLLGATDTFRAAGSEQLGLWAGRIGCEVVTGAAGADAAAVAYDALDAAVARNADVLIIDTAGRMHTKRPLMQELQKIERALRKRLDGTPHEVWVVLDAALGQNALSQARIFHDTIPLTGAIVAKLDGSSRAGFIFSVKQELDVPVRMVGLGEGEDDLVPFDASEFVDALLADDEEQA